MARIVDPARKVVRVDMGAPAFDARAGAAGAGLDEILDREFTFGGETLPDHLRLHGQPPLRGAGAPVTPRRPTAWGR